jgi:hypothetical protein
MVNWEAILGRGYDDLSFDGGRIARPVRVMYVTGAGGGQRDRGGGRARLVNRDDETWLKRAGTLGLVGLLGSGLGTAAGDDGLDTGLGFPEGSGTLIRVDCVGTGGTDVFGAKGGRDSCGWDCGSCGTDIVIGDRFPALSDGDLGMGVKKIRLRTDRVPFGNSTIYAHGSTADFTTVPGCVEPRTL